MAIISNTTPVSDSEGGTWQVVGSVDTETGVVTFTIYGSSGSILTEGSASKVTGLLNSMPAGPDNFVGKVASTVNSMNASLKQSVPPPTSDTAATKVENTPPVASETLSADEQKKLSGETIVDPDTGQTLRVAAPGSPALSGNGLSEVTNNEPIKSTTDNNKKKPPLPNPLLAYPSYTYGLSLALLTVDEYNKIIEDTKNYKANRVIIASAGRWNSDTGVSMFNRAPYFAEDFYFDNLNMTTVIGLNDHSRTTNAIDLKFTIIEPYGVTLLDRIIDLSKDIKSTNYIAQPYLLQIDFFSTNDAGEIVGIIPDQTKRIPIRLLKMDIKASAKGAEYEMEACPYNHSAWDLSSVGTPALIEVTAGSIESFLQTANEENFTKELKANRESLAAANQRSSNQYSKAPNPLIDQTSLLPASSVSSNATTTNGVAMFMNDQLYKVKSYGGALTAYYADLADRDKNTLADKYHFKVHPDILKDNGGLFNLNAETLSTAQTPMASEENGMSIRGVPGSLDHSVRIFAINTGTSIDQVIAFAMRHTKYLQGQVKPISAFNGDDVAYNNYLEEQSTIPLKWYKVVPTIKLGEYNTTQEMWTREITYHILPYTVYNTKIREGPQGTWTEPTKVHNYWYTGKNNDVLDFTMEFNALYYTAVTAYRENMSKTQNLLESINKNSQLDEDSISYRANALTPFGRKTLVQNSQQHSTGGAVTIEAIALADIESSLYTTAGGDMLQAKIKIIGDPQYIKQDDVFYAPDMTTISEQVDGTGLESRLIANGSLHMDRGEVYVQVTVKSPVDLDEATGLMKFDTKHSTSLFSGMYRILTVESTFTGGKFEQTLDVVRLPRQTALDYTNYVPAQTRARAVIAPVVASTNVDASTLTETTTTKTTGDDKAPGSAPVDDTTAPVQTSEEKALAKVDATAPETPITTQTEPVSTPSPAPPSAEKLALKAKLDSVMDTFNGAANASATADSAVVTLQARVDGLKEKIDNWSDRIQRGVLSQEDAAKVTTLIADNQLYLAAAQNNLANAQATAQAAKPAYDAAKAARDAAKAQYDQAI